jgi:hypothetical protein
LNNMGKTGRVSLIRSFDFLSIHSRFQSAFVVQESMIKNRKADIIET